MAMICCHLKHVIDIVKINHQVLEIFEIKSYWKILRIPSIAEQNQEASAFQDPWLSAQHHDWSYFISSSSVTFRMRRSERIETDFIGAHETHALEMQALGHIVLKSKNTKLKDATHNFYIHDFQYTSWRISQRIRPIRKSLAFWRSVHRNIHSKTIQWSRGEKRDDDVMRICGRWWLAVVRLRFSSCCWVILKFQSWLQSVCACVCVLFLVSCVL